MVRLVILFLTALVLSFASNEEILRLIEEVKKAPPEERYKVMNRLKMKLREMNRREREEAIRKVYLELKGEKRKEKFEHREEAHEERLEHRDYEKMEEMEEKFQEKFEEHREDISEEMGERGEHERYRY